MTGMKYKDTNNLVDVISPQNILAHNNKLFVFDKINMDEGRLYSFDEDYSKKELIIEVDEGECFFGKDGYVYMLYTCDNSLIEVYDLNGKKIKDISLAGQIFFLDVDSCGNIYAVFSEDGEMCIRVYDPDGTYVREMHSRNMPIISAMWSDGEYTFIGGFLEDLSLIVEKINCMSFIENTYDLGIKDSKLLISRILKSGDTLICIMTGNRQDCVVLIDTLSGENKKLDMGEDVRSIYDIEIRDEELRVLCDGGKVITYRMGIQGECLKEMKAPGHKSSRRTGYRYLSFIICVKNFMRDFLSLFFKVSIPLTILAMLYLGLRYGDEGLHMGRVRGIRLFFIVSLIVDFLGILAKNAAVSWKKRMRVDNLLDIYNRIEDIDSQIFKNAAFIGAMSALLVSLFTYRRAGTMAAYAVPLAAGFICAAALYGFCMRSIRRLKGDIDHMVFELLNFNEEDHELFVKIGREIKKIRKSGVEKYRIKVLMKNKIQEGTLKLIKRWSTLRGKITGDPGKLKDTKDYLVFDLNLNNRDIRYSRISVIEDFICYIGRAANISSIIIESGEDEEGMTC